MRGAVVVMSRVEVISSAARTDDAFLAIALSGQKALIGSLEELVGRQDAVEGGHDTGRCGDALGTERCVAGDAQHAVGELVPTVRVSAAEHGYGHLNPNETPSGGSALSPLRESATTRSKNRSSPSSPAKPRDIAPSNYSRAVRAGPPSSL